VGEKIFASFELHCGREAVSFKTVEPIRPALLKKPAPEAGAGVLTMVASYASYSDPPGAQPPLPLGGPHGTLCATFSTTVACIGRTKFEEAR